MADYPETKRELHVVCFDFDGVLAEDTWPEPLIGKPIPEGIAALKHYFEDGYAIVIWTARPESHTTALLYWLGHVAEVMHMIYDVRCGKPSADLYVDDRGWRPPWVEPAPLSQADKDLAVLNGVDPRDLGPDDITRMD
jgi:hypothetical protein